MALHKNIKILTIFNFFTDFRLFAPILVLYFQRVTGSFALGMSIFSVIFLSAALFEVPTGIISDKVGRKKTVIFGACASVLSLIFYAVGQSYWILMMGGIFEGLARSFYSGNNSALLHDTLAETHQQHEYHEFLGKTSSMFQLASAIAAVLGGLIASISFSLVMWVSVLPQLICLYLSFYLVEPKVFVQESTNIFQHLSTALKKFSENRKLRLLSLGSMINFGVGDASFEFQAAFYSLVWPVWALGIARMIANFSGAISFYIAGKIINKFSAIKILLVEGIISPIVKVLTILFISPLSPAIMAFMSILYGSSNVAGNSLQQKEFTDEQRATMGSLLSLGGAICNAVSAFILGIIADHWGVALTLIFAQVILLLNNFFYIKVYKHG